MAFLYLLVKKNNITRGRSEKGKAKVDTLDSYSLWLSSILKVSFELILPKKIFFKPILQSIIFSSDIHGICREVPERMFCGARSISSNWLTILPFGFQNELPSFSIINLYSIVPNNESIIFGAENFRILADILGLPSFEIVNSMFDPICDL